MSAPLALDEHIALGYFVEIARDDGELVLRSSSAEARVSGPPTLAAAIDSARRPTEIASLASRYGLCPNALRECLQDLTEAGMILRCSAELTATDPATYLQIFHANCEVRAADVVNTRFWQLVTSGQASEPTVRGWCFELYQFVRLSNEYMPLAVADARLPNPQRLLMAKHCVEESAHGPIFERGLMQMGYPITSIENAVPLPTTSALVNVLAELAMSDTLSYLATFAVMQQTRVRRALDEYEQFRNGLSQMYPFAAPFFTALHQHSQVDAELEHNDIVFDHVVAQLGVPHRQQREAVATAVLRFSWAFEEFFDGILRWYGGGLVVAPRRPVTIAQFP